MGQKTLKELLKEANSSIQSISPNKAMDLVGNIEFIFIDFALTLYIYYKF